jgi:PKD repeat protein
MAIYVADRGVDNNDQPTENDGKIYEFSPGGATGQAPVANFNWTQGSGFTVAFDDTSTNQPTEWFWEFGDPGTTSDFSTEPSPSYTYPAAGTYQVTLTATNDIGFDSDTKTITVSSGPPPTSGNVMTNGSFEMANPSNQPTSWTTNAGFTRSNAIAAKDGSFVGRHSATGNVTYTVYSDAPIVAGRTYTLSGWYNAPTTADAFQFIAKIKWRGPGGNLTTVVVKKFTDDTAGTWVQFSGSVVAPSTATTARVMMTAKSMAGTFYVDGLVLQEAP